MNLIDPNGMSAEEPGWLKGFFQKVGNWAQVKGWWTNSEYDKIKDTEMLEEVIVIAKKPKNKQKRGYGFWGESDEQLIDWPKAENGPDDFNESPEMGGAPNVAKGTIGEKVAKALNLAKKWLGIGDRKENCAKASGKRLEYEYIDTMEVRDTEYRSSDGKLDSIVKNTDTIHFKIKKLKMK